MMRFSNLAATTAMPNPMEFGRKNWHNSWLFGGCTWASAQTFWQSSTGNDLFELSVVDIFDAMNAS